MFEIKKTFVVSIAHKLNLSYRSKCERFHGHDLKITVYCRSEDLNKDGMVVDFTHVKKHIDDVLDHNYLNEVELVDGDKVNNQPTAENIAFWICSQINYILVKLNPGAICYKVDVQESEGNIASYCVEG